MDTSAIRSASPSLLAPSWTLRLFVAAALLAACTPLLAARAQTGAVAPAESPPAIRVEGVGTVSAAPDLATAELGVVVVADEPGPAFAEASRVARELRDAVAELGVADADVRTAAIDVRREERFGPERPGADDAAPRVVYRVRQGFEVTVRDLDRLGPLLQAAIEAGANDLGSVRFGISEPAALEREARSLAVADARARAEALAALAGVGVGAPLELSELSDAQPFAGAAALRAEGFGGGVPVAPGELSVTVRVAAAYRIVAPSE